MPFNQSRHEPELPSQKGALLSSCITGTKHSFSHEDTFAQVSCTRYHVQKRGLDPPGWGYRFKDRRHLWFSLTNPRCMGPLF